MNMNKLETVEYSTVFFNEKLYEWKSRQPQMMTWFEENLSGTPNSLWEATNLIFIETDYVSWPIKFHGSNVYS